MLMQLKHQFQMISITSFQGNVQNAKGFTTNRNALPFDRAHQLLTKDVMVVAAGSDWIVRAKTGWSGSIGWWVGWVERPTGTVFFALNIDTPRRQDDLAKRQSIARQVLRAIQALPVAP